MQRQLPKRSSLLKAPFAVSSCVPYHIALWQTYIEVHCDVAAIRVGLSHTYVHSKPTNKQKIFT